jgi:hypothetical protein
VAQRLSVNDMLKRANQAAAAPARPRKAAIGLFRGAFRAVFGVRARFLTGVVLLALCAWWTQQNPELTNKLYNLVTDFSWPAQWPETKPFSFLYFPPEAIARPLLNSFNPGIAGLLLILSVFFENRKILVAFYLAAVVILLGQLAGMPVVELPLLGELSPGQVSLAAGLLLAAAGVVLGWLLDKGD